MKSELGTPAPWGPDVIDDAFEERCVDAALAAYAIGRMRVEIQTTRFVPLTAHQYVTGLGRLAKVEASHALRWAGLANRDDVQVETAPKWASLLRTLGVHYDEALLLLRVSVAEQGGYGPVPMFVARRGHADFADVQLSSALALQDLESEYDEGEQKNLDLIVEFLEAAYRGQDSEERR